MRRTPNFKIRHLDEVRGQIVVEADGFDAPFAIDLPVENGQTLSPEELRQYIRGFIPVQALERKEQLQKGIGNIAALRALVEPPPPPPPPAPPTLEQRRAAMVISRRQFFQALALTGEITRNEAAMAAAGQALPQAMAQMISQLPSENDRFAAEMLMRSAVEFQRTHPLTAVFAGRYGWSDAQVDQFFTSAMEL